MLGRRVVLAATALAVVVVPAVAGGARAVAGTVPVASTLAPADPVVGALFNGTSTTHSCTASVVDSTTRDVVVTAAHCVHGTGTSLRFVPGYSQGSAPSGSWQVTAAYADPAWISAGDPEHDVAFLTVAPLGGKDVEDVVGADALAAAPAAGQAMTVIGYVQGSGDAPISCDVPAYVVGDYPAFDCHGYYTGTSGSPFLVSGAGGRTVTGVIGGYQRGGATESTSYSSPFGSGTFALLARAEQHGAGDAFPASQQVAITSTPPSPALVGATYAAAATGGGSGQPVVFSPGPGSTGCSVGSTGTVTLTGGGRCVIDADQAGGDGFMPASTAAQSFAVKQTQTIRFTSTPPAPGRPGGTWTATATGGGSGQPVVFSTTSSTCTVASGGAVSFTALGRCVVTARQAGSPTFQAAPPVTQAVNVRGTQTITFTSSPPRPAVVGGGYQVTATGGASGAPVTFAAAAGSSACSVGTTGAVTFTAAGTCTIEARQAATSTYTAAPVVRQTVGVTAS